MDTQTPHESEVKQQKLEKRPRGLPGRGNSPARCREVRGYVREALKWALLGACPCTAHPRIYWGGHSQPRSFLNFTSLWLQPVEPGTMENLVFACLARSRLCSSGQCTDCLVHWTVGWGYGRGCPAGEGALKDRVHPRPLHFQGASGLCLLSFKTNRSKWLPEGTRG